jgi:hypothetical protein
LARSPIYNILHAIDHGLQKYLRLAEIFALQFRKTEKTVHSFLGGTHTLLLSMTKKLALVIVSLGLISLTANAANPASDNAADIAYSGGWSSGSNGGIGFGPWDLGVSINDPNRDGFLIGSSSSNGNPPSGNIDTSGKSWGMYANGHNQVLDALAVAYRPFMGSLAVGQTTTLNMDNGFVDSGPPGIVGFSLMNADPVSSNALFSTLPNTNTRFAFSFTGGDTNYKIALGDGMGSYNTIDTGTGFTDGGLSLAFTLTGANTFSLRINSGSAISGTLGGSSSDALNGIALFNYVAGSGSSNDAFFNSLAIVPEPASIVLLVLGAVSLPITRRFRE